MVWAHHYFCKLESLEKSKFFFLSLLSPTDPMPKLEMCLKTHLKTLPPSFISCIIFWNLFNSRRMPLVTWYDYFISYSRLFWDVAGVILTRTKTWLCPTHPPSPCCGCCRRTCYVFKPCNSSVLLFNLSYAVTDWSPEFLWGAQALMICS